MSSGYRRQLDQWDSYDRAWTWFLCLVVVVLTAFALDINMRQLDAAKATEPTPRPEPIFVTTTYLSGPVYTVTTSSTLPAPTTTTTMIDTGSGVGTTVVTMVGTTMVGTTVVSQQSPVVSQPAAPKWQPGDECARVDISRIRGRGQSVMRWCRTVAYYLDLGERNGAWEWERGDLTRLMAIIACESNGRESAVNPRSGTMGLFQHMPRYWAERGARASVVLDFDNPTITMPYDNIAVGVWLYKMQGARHWPNCGRW